MNLPSIHGVWKIVAPHPTNLVLTSRFDPIFSVLIPPCFLLGPVGSYPSNRSKKISLCRNRRCIYSSFQEHFKRFFFVILSCSSFDDLIRLVSTDFPLISSVSFRTQWFAHRNQTRIIKDSTFTMPSFSWLPVQKSGRLHSSCRLLIFKHSVRVTYNEDRLCH